MNKQTCMFLCIVSFITVMPDDITFASVRYDDIVVSVESSPAGESYFGYAEYKVQATNQSPDNSHKVTVFIPFESYGYGDNIKRISRTFIVSPSSSASVSIFQPPLAVQGRDMGVMIDGVKQKESISLSTFTHCPANFSFHSGFTPINPVCILLSRNVIIDDFQNGIDNAYSTSVSGGGSGTSKVCNFIKSDTDVQIWSSNWLSFSRYEGVVVTSSDMEAMPVSTKDALLEYVYCGGSLLILGKTQLPDDWQGAPVQSKPFDLRYLGFGIVVQTDTTDVKSWSSEVWKRLRTEIWIPTSKQLQEKMSITNANKSFAVIENLTVPVRGLFLLVLLFAVVIGPINLFVLSYKKKKIWMLWTVPAISVVASLAVFSYAAFAEGWKGHERIQSFTILNEKNHKAASIAIDAFYCPLTPRKGLRFSYETEVSLLGMEEQAAGRDRTVDWTSDQHFDTGWVTARVPAHFLLRKCQLTRVRLKINKNESGYINVVNGLGCDISRLYYADNSGEIYYTENIKAGEQKSLTPDKTSLPLKIERDIWRKSYSEDWKRLFGKIANNPTDFLIPDSYMAIVDDCIFIEKPLADAVKRRSESVIFGFF